MGVGVAEELGLFGTCGNVRESGRGGMGRRGMGWGGWGGGGGEGNVQPGVEALGYVNNTTPLLDSSTNFPSVVFVPSCVSISPPKVARSIVDPTSASPAAFASAFPTTASLTASTVSLTESCTFSATDLSASAFLPFAAAAGAFFFAGRAGAGGAGASLRLRSSTGMVELEVGALVGLRWGWEEVRWVCGGARCGGWRAFTWVFDAGAD